MILLAGGAFLLDKATAQAPAQPISYWLADGRGLGVQVIAGPRSFCGIASVDQTSSEVRVRVECREPLLTSGSSAAGYPYYFLLRLEAPLGGRRVIDGDGNPGTICTTAGCVPSGS